MLTLTLGVGCSSNDSAGGPQGDGGASGAGSSTGVTSAASSGVSSSSAVVATSVGAGGGQTTFVCDPPAAPGSIYEIASVSYDIDQIDPVSMCQYRGEVMLIVNTAAL
jgi:hypothetical protein